ncbi:hypothetical protein R1sor_019848 [Riccia sorocarpa]|uniref:Uncharacterized protein n=1 Tax=Riccia sorocarpa TaxID=122646 RepID=A0ABD3IEC0_9MARC
MSPFNLVRVNYGDYVNPLTIHTEMVPNLVILPEEWEVWDAMGIQVTPPVVRNLDETVCYARLETGVRHTQSEGILLQDPVVTPSTVQDSHGYLQDHANSKALGVQAPQADAYNAKPQNEQGKIIIILTVFSERASKAGGRRHKRHFMNRHINMHLKKPPLTTSEETRGTAPSRYGKCPPLIERLSHRVNYRMCSFLHILVVGCLYG